MAKDPYYVSVQLTPNHTVNRMFPVYDVITPETEEAWKRYLAKKMQEVLKPETMETEGFKAVLKEMEAEKAQMERARIAMENSRERNRRCSVMTRPRVNFIPPGLHVDYEEAYDVFLKQEVRFVPTDHEDFLVQLRLIERWSKKSIPQILELKRPDAAYAIALAVCRSLPIFVYREDLQVHVQPLKTRIKKLIVVAFESLKESVERWNNEEKRLEMNALIQEQSTKYSNFRGLEKTLMALQLASPIEGEPIAIQREPSAEEKDMERRRQRDILLAERRRIQEEKEARSVIPLNADYERRIFDGSYIGPDGVLLDTLLENEKDAIQRVLDDGHPMQAALQAMQLIKSLCRHYISESHWDYYDDWYSPDFTVKDLLKLFQDRYAKNSLPVDVVEYLRTAWKEIQEEESVTDYYMPSCELGI